MITIKGNFKVKAIGNSLYLLLPVESQQVLGKEDGSVYVGELDVEEKTMKLNVKKADKVEES